jgi:hypothetical protein
LEKYQQIECEEFFTLPQNLNKSKMGKAIIALEVPHNYHENLVK